MCSDSQQGFTLIELLIVISLIVILTIIASTYYFNLLSQARDSVRIADITAISTALEVNRTPSGYIPLQVNQFSKFSSIDPSNNLYCISGSNLPTPVVSSPWGSNCPVGFLPVLPGTPQGSFKEFIVCAYLENRQIGSITNAYCLTQKQ